jgi:hypothetical protein
LKLVVQRKRNGTLAGLALLKELEELAKETAALIEESQRPIVESFMKAAQERAPTLSTEDAGKIAIALIAKADEILFPGWTEQEHVDTELFRALTTILAKQFAPAGLHGTDKDFVDRCIKLLRRKNHRAQSND